MQYFLHCQKFLYLLPLFLDDLLGTDDVLEIPAGENESDGLAFPAADRGHVAGNRYRFSVSVSQGNDTGLHVPLGVAKVSNQAPRDLYVRGLHETGKMLLDRLRKRHGIEPFGFTDLSFAIGVSGKSRLLTLDSMKGRKIRTFAPAINPAVASWGANPVVMGFGDVPSALESGVLDGVVTSIGGWRSITEQTPYFTVAGIGTVTFDSYWVGASKDWWEGLNDPTKARLRELLAGAMNYQDEANWCNDQFAIKSFEAKSSGDKGIYSATADEARPLQQAIGNGVADFIKASLPEEAGAWVDRYVKEGREAAARLPAGTDPLESLDCGKFSALLKK